MGDVGAVAKLAQYTLNLLAEPLLATLRARREVKANRIRAEGQAEIMEILAIGEARAELAGRAVRELAENPQGLAALIENEIDRRVETHFQKRVNNLAQIVARAERALPPGQVPDVEPDMAWTSSYSEAAQDISDEEMQEMWARVLAGEVASQGSTSVKTLDVLRNLDQSIAQHFRRLCSLAVSVAASVEIRAPTDSDQPTVRYRIQSFDHRVPSLGGNAGDNSLREYGPSFDVLNLLNEHELVIADYNSWFDYRPSIAIKREGTAGLVVPLGFKHQGQMWGLIPHGEHDLSQEFRVSGVALTRAGRELSKVVELEPVPKYTEALKGYFAEKGLDMVQV